MKLTEVVSVSTSIVNLYSTESQVLPLLKKAGLDSSHPGNYKLVSNFSTISKVLELLVLTRLRIQEATFHRDRAARGVG